MPRFMHSKGILFFTVEKCLFLLSNCLVKSYYPVFQWIELRRKTNMYTWKYSAKLFFSEVASLSTENIFTGNNDIDH